jgi:hypothetical protein
MTPRVTHPVLQSSLVRSSSTGTRERDPGLAGDQRETGVLGLPAGAELSLAPTVSRVQLPGGPLRSSTSVTTTIRRSGRLVVGRNTSRRTRGTVTPLGGEGLSHDAKRRLDLDATVSTPDLRCYASSPRADARAGQARTVDGGGSGFVVLHGGNMLTDPSGGKGESTVSRKVYA